MMISSQRARQSKPPPVYEEMLKVARNVCHAASLPERKLMSRDTYGSGGDKDKRMRELRNCRGDKDRQDRDNRERDRARDKERRRD